MGGVADHLLPSERLLWRGHRHWYGMWKGPLWLLLGGLVLMSTGTTLAMVGFLLIAWAAFISPYLLAFWWTETFAITDRRSLVLRGILNKSSHEMPHARMESIAVRRGLIGLLLGYGALVLTGTGGTRLEMPDIGRPGERRSLIEQGRTPAL